MGMSTFWTESFVRFISCSPWTSVPIWRFRTPWLIGSFSSFFFQKKISRKLYANFPKKISKKLYANLPKLFSTQFPIWLKFSGGDAQLANVLGETFQMFFQFFYICVRHSCISQENNRIRKYFFLLELKKNKMKFKYLFWWNIFNQSARV